MTKAELIAARGSPIVNETAVLWLRLSKSRLPDVMRARLDYSKTARNTSDVPVMTSGHVTVPSSVGPLVLAHSVCPQPAKESDYLHCLDAGASTFSSRHVAIDPDGKAEIKWRLSMSLPAAHEQAVVIRRPTQAMMVIVDAPPSFKVSIERHNAKFVETFDKSATTMNSLQPGTRLLIRWRPKL